jgi:hypothetical protein
VDRGCPQYRSHYRPDGLRIVARQFRPRGDGPLVLPCDGAVHRPLSITVALEVTGTKGIKMMTRISKDLLGIKPMTFGSGRHRQLSDVERKAALSQLRMLDPWRELRPTMPAQYIYAFLLVALHEGKSVQEYATMAGVSKSVMSRHILDIGERDRHMEEGFGLVTYRPNPMNLRQHEIFLTDKGRALINRLARNAE